MLAHANQGERQMDWIEQLLGFSPDGGDGTTEAMIVFAGCAVFAIIIYRRVLRAKTPRAKSSGGA
jgi:hypothetical protein